MSANLCGNKIRELRKINKMDQVELAAAMSVEHDIKLTQSDVSEIERGIRGVKDFELLAFSVVYGVSADYLLKDEEK